MFIFSSYHIPVWLFRSGQFSRWLFRNWYFFISWFLQTHRISFHHLHPPCQKGEDYGKAYAGLPVVWNFKFHERELNVMAELSCKEARNALKLCAQDFGIYAMVIFNLSGFHLQTIYQTCIEYVDGKKTFTDTQSLKSTSSNNPLSESYRRTCLYQEEKVNPKEGNEESRNRNNNCLDLESLSPYWTRSLRAPGDLSKKTEEWIW